METLQIIRKLEKYATFNIDTISNLIDKDKTYAKVYLNRLKNKDVIKQIQRNVYTVQEDPLIIASRIIWPSYISLWAAFRYHDITEQIPNRISVVTTRAKSREKIQIMNSTIVFERIKPLWFFGFSKIRIKDFEVFMAEPEKALIDAVLLKKISTAEIYSILEDNIKSISSKKIVDYILRTQNNALAKRFGWMLDSLGFNYAKKLEKQVYETMIPLDYTRPPSGPKDKKWGIIINIGGIQ